jgi:hypothetical protein
MGIKHYLTSERFLDETLDRYPEWSHGGNPFILDVEAVRMDLPRPLGMTSRRGSPTRRASPLLLRPLRRTQRLQCVPSRPSAVSRCHLFEEGVSRYFAEREVDWSDAEYLIAAE